MSEEKKLKVEFAPGAFDNFDGTQEELNELIAEIHRMVDTGEIFENSKTVDFDELMEEDPELAMKLAESLSDEPSIRSLQ